MYLIIKKLKFGMLLLERFPLNKHSLILYLHIMLIKKMTKNQYKSNNELQDENDKFTVELESLRIHLMYIVK
jgi:hypothetical protein